MKNKIIRTVITILFICLLIFIGFFALLFAAFEGTSGFYFPFIIIAFILLSVWIVVWALQLIKVKYSLFSLLAIILSGIIAITIYEQRAKYIENIPVVDDQGVNLYSYQPFDDESKVVRLNEEATLHLVDSLPTIDGATALYPLYSAFVQATYLEKEYDPYDGDVRSNTTPIAYQRLLDGEVDLIFCAAPSTSQIAQANSLGKTFNLTPIGKEAFVFFVNNKNPISELSVNQIQDIYSGKITNWKQLGGKDSDIKAFQRPKNSGSQTMLEKIMGDIPLMIAPQMDVVRGMGGIIEQTATYKNFYNAIGYTFLYFATGMIGNDQIKLLKVNGVYPNKTSIANGEYPFVGDFYAITTDTQNENVEKLTNWILSEQGQFLIDKTGYTSLK